MTPSPSKIAVPSITIMFGQYESNGSNDAFGKWDSYLMWKLTQMTVLHSCQLLPVLPQGTRHLWSIYCHPAFYAPVVWKSCRSLGNCVSLHHLLVSYNSGKQPLCLSLSFLRVWQWGVFIQDTSSVPDSRIFIWNMLKMWHITDSLDEWINSMCHFHNDLICYNLYWNTHRHYTLRYFIYLFLFIHYFVDYFIILWKSPRKLGNLLTETSYFHLQGLQM